MSKKGIALLLAAVMAFACTSALAATDVVIDTGLSEFDVHFTADMDVEINSLTGDGYCLITFGDVENQSPDQMVWLATITVSDDTAFENKDLSDATDEQLSQLFNALVVADEGGENPYTYDIMDMDDGVRALSIVNKDTHEEAWVFTIEQGVLVQVIGFYNDNRAVSDEDIANAAKLMDAFKFIPADAAGLNK